MANYKFPRVDVSSYARVKSTARPDTPDTTVLFMPIMSSIGPSNEIIKIHDVDEYVSYFGTPAFDKIGVSAIALTRWLNAGGTLYAYRLVERGMQPEQNVEGTIIPATEGPEYASYTLYANTEETVTGEDGESTTVTNSKAIFGYKAKYAGDAYNKLVVKIEPVAPRGDLYNITVWLSDVPTSMETYNRIPSSQIANIIGATSSLIQDIYFDFNDVKVVTSPATEDTDATTRAYTFSDLIGGVNSKKFAVADVLAPSGLETRGIKYSVENEKFLKGSKSYYELLKQAYSSELNEDGEVAGEITKLFLNVNATPVDTILDPGYSRELKEILYNSIKYVLTETSREDLFVAFSVYEIPERKQSDGTKVADGKLQRPVDCSSLFGSGTIKYTNDDTGETEGTSEVSGKLNGWFAVYDQYGVITDTIYNQGADLYIPLSIMYAQNSVYNDINYSMHRPTAGETYGVISGYKILNSNPNARQKDNLFRKRFNYAEQTSRSIEIMTNRTFYHPDDTGVQSALDFINNVRVKNKIVRDLRKILRKYLYEYADGDTLLRCLNECNEYINGWINNKALTTGSIDVQIDPYTEEYLSAKLYLKFRGCIEFIDVSIYLD